MLNLEKVNKNSMAFGRYLHDMVSAMDDVGRGQMIPGMQPDPWCNSDEVQDGWVEQRRSDKN